jgi:glucose 1-dehydrogenase
MASKDKAQQEDESRMPTAAIPRMLTGQKALVTGGSSGIGQATAIAFAESGADVVLTYRSNEEGAEETLERVRRTGARGLAVQVDVSEEKQVLKAFETIIGEFGRIDILFGNAGIQADGPIEEMTLEDWNKVLHVNLTGQFLCAREAVRHFRRQGASGTYSCSVGKIVFNSSVHDIIPWKHRVNYTASKGGLAMFMKSLAQEVAPDRIRVNSVAPGAIKTEINRESWEDPDQVRKMLEKIPYNRVGVPRDIARVVVWLASDQSDYITGSTIYVDGGMTLYPSFQEGG